MAIAASVRGTVQNLREARAELSQSITSLHKNRDRLARALDRTTRLISCGPRCFVATNDSGVVQRANHAAQSHLGEGEATETKSIIGASLVDLVIESDRDRVKDCIEALRGRTGANRRWIALHPRAGRRYGVALQGLVKAERPADRGGTFWCLSDASDGTLTGGVSLTLTSRVQSAQFVRRAVRQFSTTIPLSERRSLEVQVAIGEAVANAILHAYPPDSGGGFRVKLWRDAMAMFAEIEDYGHWKVKVQPSDGGGFGLGLMRGLADAVSIRPTPQGTTVHMLFLLQ